jgi:MraZ protein
VQRSEEEAGGPGIKGVFVGTYEHTLDPKKRLTIPSEWRECVGTPNSLYVLPSADQKCLIVFPGREMLQRLQRIRNLSYADARARQFARILGSQSQIAPWDTQGRIRVNDALLDFAQLKEQVVLVGVIEGFELWNPDLWRPVGSSGQGSLSDVARYAGF